MHEKKPKQIAVHLSSDRYIQITRFAESEGTSNSQFVAGLVEEFIKGKEHEYRLLQTFLEVDGSLGFEGSESSAG